MATSLWNQYIANKALGRTTSFTEAKLIIRASLEFLTASAHLLFHQGAGLCLTRLLFLFLEIGGQYEHKMEMGPLSVKRHRAIHWISS
ncbi:hypothetical protein evm_012600 [Chilo suppressalis]|nr:hypothetical protein evm_014262 [Chilo suppressalis]RVE42554.1 hypothetical protein evm_012802 [Chilo suppressalis]RVE42776.1 hypothetical protein evm_012600 [Chilo suppressalis]